MHVQSRFVASNLDLDLRPLARNEVHVAFVLLREFLSQSLPRDVRERDVLGRMVAPDLIVDASVRWAKIKAFVFEITIRCTGDDSERQANKSSSAFTGSGGRFAGQLCFDDAVLNLGLS